MGASDDEDGESESPVAKPKKPAKRPDASDDENVDPESPDAKPKVPAKRPDAVPKARSVLPPAQERVANLVEGTPEEKPKMSAGLLGDLRDIVNASKMKFKKPAPKPREDENADKPGGPSVRQRMFDLAQAKSQESGNASDNEGDEEWQDAALLDALLGGLMDRSMEAEFATGVAFSCNIEGDTERCKRQKAAMQLLAANAYYPLGGEELRDKHPDAKSLIDAILREAGDISG